MSRSEFRRRFTVYNNNTDLPIIVDEVSENCAKAMGITLGTFYHVVLAQRKGSKARGSRWVIIEHGSREARGYQPRNRSGLKPKDHTPNTVGWFIRRCRMDHGFTLKEVEAGTGITLGTVSRYECNQSVPSFWNLLTLADFFDVSIDELIGRKRGANES